MAKTNKSSIGGPGGKSGKKQGFKPNLPKGFFYMVFSIQNWKKWDFEINEAVQTFRKKYPVYPHILLASRATHAKFDILAFNLHPEYIRLNDDAKSIPEELVWKPGEGLGGFDAGEYKLDFFVLDEAPLGYYVLVYDSDPDGGEPLPDFGFNSTETLPRKQAIG